MATCGDTKLYENTACARLKRHIYWNDTHTIAVSLCLALSMRADTYADWLIGLCIFEVLSYCEPEYVGFLILSLSQARTSTRHASLPPFFLCTLFSLCHTVCVRASVCDCLLLLFAVAFSDLLSNANSVIYYIWECCRHHCRTVHTWGASQCYRV